MKLLDKAKSVKPHIRHKIMDGNMKHSKEEMELVIAWIRGAISIKQLKSVIPINGRGVTNYYPYLYAIGVLRRAILEGHLIEKP